MAKLSKIGTEILWKLEKSVKVADQENITRYALRSDGVLLSKYVLVRPNYRHDYGWKVAYKKVKTEAKQKLIERGYCVI